MIWTLLSLAIIALFMGGMILAAKVPPHEDEAEGENRAVSRRLEFIRRSSLLPLTLKPRCRAGLARPKPLGFSPPQTPPLPTSP